MNKNKELAVNTAILTVGKICTQFMSFFLMPLYTAVLSTEEYGVVDLVGTYTSLLLPIVLLQIDQGLFRFLIEQRNNDDGKKRILTTSLLFAVVQMVMAVMVFMVIGSIISTKYKWFLLLNIIGAIYSSMMLQTSRGLGDNTGYAIASFISALTNITLNILLILVFRLGAVGMLFATISGHFVTALFLFIKEKVYKYIDIGYANKNELKKLLRYSVPLVPNALSWWALGASDRSIVLIFLGASFNGLLSIGHKFSNLFMIFYNIFNISWTESAALHMKDSDREEFFSGVIVNMFKLFCSVAIGMIACMPFVFPLMINEKFSGAYGIIPLFMLSSIFNVVVGLYSVIYVALKKTKEIAKTSVYAGIINIVAHIVLVKFIGLYAAPVSTIIAFGLMAIYRYFDLKRYINVPLSKKVVLEVSGMFIVSCISFYSNNMILQVVILVVIACIIFVINKTMLLQGLKMVFKTLGSGTRNGK